MLKLPLAGASGPASSETTASDAWTRAVGLAAWRDATPTINTASSIGSAVTWGEWKRAKLKSNGRVTLKTWIGTPSVDPDS